MTEQSKVPFIPDAAPFNEDQRAWLSGFLAGLHSRAAMSAAQGAVPGQAVAEAGATQAAHVEFLYGTQTGNAESVAQDAARSARAKGFSTNVAGLDDISMDKLAETDNAIIVVSTYGEGEMPDNAQIFWDSLSSDTAPRLEKLSYGVLALGDTSYDEFCHAGKLIDMRLEQLGAKRLLGRVDCDVDFEDPATAWIGSALPLISDADPTTAANRVTNDNGTAVADARSEKPKWNRKNPYPAPVVDNRLLSGSGSAKEIRHFAFDLSGSGLTYEAGDSLGVMPVNNVELVDAIMARLGLQQDAVIEEMDLSVREALRTKFEISTPPKSLVTAIAERTGHDELCSIVTNGDKEALDAFLWGRDTLDLLNLDDGLVLQPSEFFNLLKPLQHRAYSISSSPKAHGSEVHLTVASVRWDYDGRPHRGVCSTFMADELSVGDTAPVFVSPNKSFRPPADNDAPMIMVGPGTGIAPFRAFLEERREVGATGRNWLFFGDQHRAEDFIYEDEISSMSADGLLTRLDLAFSRDQSEKFYVQSRMKENGKALFSWLDEGGHFYVCGDATRMARDVDTALHEIIAEHGGLSADEAAGYVNTLKREKRYLRDVY
ncbi:MAG: sulfite reductase subunit alpha [Pseudomonadota bacterium]